MAAGNYTITAIAYSNNNITTPTSAANISVLTPCAAPTFNPTAGTFTTSTSVTINTSTGGATINYTTNGTTPSSTVGTVYSSPVSITRHLHAAGHRLRDRLCQQYRVLRGLHYPVRYPDVQPGGGNLHHLDIRHHHDHHWWCKHPLYHQWHYAKFDRGHGVQ